MKISLPKIRLNKQAPIWILLGILLVSLPGFIVVKKLKNDLSYQKLNNKWLEEQIQSLRVDYQNLTTIIPKPSPELTKYVNPNDLKTKDYKIECFSDQQLSKVDPQIIQSINKLEKQKIQISQICLNKDNQQLATIINYRDPQIRGGLGGSIFKLYQVASNSAQVRYEKSGNYLSGECARIVKWNEQDDIYYECSSGDGPWGQTATYRDSTGYGSSGRSGIIKSCYTFGDKTDCTSYCDNSSACGSGEVCNLENSSCVKLCKTEADCAAKSCSALGPVMACN